MESKLYEFRFDGSWLGGKAVVKAVNQEEAWKMLKNKWEKLEPLDECLVKELSDDDGVKYFDSGEY